MEQSYRNMDLELTDTKINCVDCDVEFILSLGEQRWFKDKGFSMPKRCPDCRARRKEDREKEAK